MIHPSITQLLDLLAIPSISTQEQATAAYVQKTLLRLGIPPENIRQDQAFQQSEYGGTTGNLIVHLPRRGNHQGAARLFMCHMDTVALCRGCQPRFVPAGDGQPSRIINDNPASALGGDCRTGVAALLHLGRLLANSASHPPVWLVFTVQEELGLIGARGLDLALLQGDAPVMGFNFDGGHVDRIVSAITGTTRFFIDLEGKAAHSGVNPQDGVSTAAAMATALAELVRDGWHGPINKPHGRGSANIGVLQGGEMTNTVMDKLVIRGEARSHDAAFRQEIVDRYRQTFARCAAATQNAAGQCAKMSWKLGPCYESFALDKNHPVVRHACDALRRLNIEPVLEINDGGMDNNWLNAKGLPAVALGTGQRQVHTVNEWIDTDEFLIACELSQQLAVA